jgi:hypothetical protein
MGQVFFKQYKLFMKVDREFIKGHFCLLGSAQKISGARKGFFSIFQLICSRTFL